MSRHLPLHLRLIALLGLIVPRRLRTDWRQEWEAELRVRETLLSKWDRLDRRGRLDLVRRSAGAFWDALWLQTYRWEDDMIQDVRYGLRVMSNNLGLTFVCVATLALGMGANTAIFSVVNAALLRPLPYPNATKLVALYSTSLREGGEGPISPVTYLDVKQRSASFAALGAISNKGWPANLTGDGDAERLQGFQVTADLFPTLGVEAELGRTFRPDEDRPGAERVVVVSHSLWQRRFGGDPAAIGRVVTLNGEHVTIVGVMPADFRFLVDTDVWTPIAFTPKDERDEANYLFPLGRLGQGVTADAAAAEVATIYRNALGEKNPDFALAAAPLQSLIAEGSKTTLWVLFAAVAFVLLIACANVSNLLLARGSVRRRELAVRAALGAGRLRVVRQLLVESSMLALLGGLCGLAVAYAGMHLVVAALPANLASGNARLATLRLDGWAFAFTFGLALATTVTFGLVPALRSSKLDLNETLNESGRGDTQAHGHGGLRSTLVVTEVALATVLLVGSGLVLKSVWKLAHVHPGFETAGALTARIDPAMEFPATVTFYDQLLERLQAIPGVRDVGIINSLDSTWGCTVEEHPPVSAEETPSAANNQVSQDYFRAMGIPLRAGRFFTHADAEGTTRVAIIDETLARKAFPNEDPIGKHLKFVDASREIVGVVGAAHFYSLSDDPIPHVYVPYRQENWGSMRLVVRTDGGEPSALEPAIRREVAAVDPNVPIYGFATLDKEVGEWSAPYRVVAALLAGFAALAALLAAVGIYGVLAYAVAQRAHEIGIRMALGANRGDVFRLVLGSGLRVVAVGLLIGTAGALALTRWMESLLFGVTASDPSTYVWIAVGFASVAALACAVPARRATRTDPIVAIRYG